MEWTIIKTSALKKVHVLEAEEVDILNIFDDVKEWVSNRTEGNCSIRMENPSISECNFIPENKTRRNWVCKVHMHGAKSHPNRLITISIFERKVIREIVTKASAKDIEEFHQIIQNTYAESL